MSFLNSLKLSLENEELLDENGEVMEVTDADMAEADAEFVESELVRQQVEQEVAEAERAEAIVEELEGTNEAVRAAVDNGTFTREAAAMVEAQRRTAAAALNLDPEEGAGEELVDNPGLESMVFNQGVLSLEQNEGMIAKIKKVIATIIDKVIAGYEKVKLFFQKLFNYLPSQIKKLKERWAQVKPENISDELVKDINEKYKDKFVSLTSVDETDTKDINDLLAFAKAGQELVDKAASRGIIETHKFMYKFINHEFGTKNKDGAYMQFGSLRFEYDAAFDEQTGKGHFNYTRRKMTLTGRNYVKSGKELYDMINNFVNAVGDRYNDIKKIDGIAHALSGKIKTFAIVKKVESMDKNYDTNSDFTAGMVSGAKIAAGVYRATYDIEQGLLGTIREAMSIADKVISKATGKKEETKEA